MTVNYIIDLLKDCEYIKGYKVGAGFLSEKANSVSVIPEGDEEVLRSYADGGKILGYNFSLIVRLSSVMGDNLQNISFLEEFCRWLSSISPIKEMEGVPLGISIIQGATLYEDNIHSLKYKIKCRFEYLQE